MLAEAFVHLQICCRHKNRFFQCGRFGKNCKKDHFIGIHLCTGAFISYYNISIAFHSTNKLLIHSSIHQQLVSTACSSVISHYYNIKILAEEAEYILFHNSCSENHCLHHIYTVNEKPGAMTLHTRGHDFTLPFVKYNFN